MLDVESIFDPDRNNRDPAPASQPAPAPASPPAAESIDPARHLHELEARAELLRHDPATLLFAELDRAGFTINANGNELDVQSRDLLTAGQQASIAKYRADLLILCWELQEADRICRDAARQGTGRAAPAEQVRRWLADTQDKPGVTFIDWQQQKGQPQ